MLTALLFNFLNRLGAGMQCKLILDEALSSSGLKGTETCFKREVRNICSCQAYNRRLNKVIRRRTN